MKRLMTTLLVVLLCGMGFCWAEATVTGAVKCIPSGGGEPSDIDLTGTVTLWQNDVATTYTADINSGSYSISSVPAGTYTAKFVGSFQGKDCAGDNRAVVTESDASVECNITANLTASTGVTVSGTVQYTWTDGNTYSDNLSGTVQLLQNGEVKGSTTELTQGPDNLTVYSIANVEAGTYTLTFEGRARDLNNLFYSQEITVASENITDANILAVEKVVPVTISGNITIENPENPKQPIAGGVKSGTVSLWQNGEKKHEGNVTTADNVSSYTLSATPGTYTLAFDGVGNDDKVLFHKAYRFTVPTTDRPYDFTATVNTTGVTVSGAVTFDDPYSEGMIVEGSAYGTVKLSQNGSAVYTGTVASDNSVSSYAIHNVANGTYTLSFEGEGYGKILIHEEDVEIANNNVTKDFKADIDDTRGYTTITVHYGENYQDYGNGYGSWGTDIRLENATVTLTPASGTPLVGTSDANGTVKFLVAKDADLTYTLKIEPQGEKYKDTTIKSFVAYGDNGHGGNDFKTLDVYVQKIPLPTVKVSGKVRLNGELLKTLPVEDMAIGIKTVEGKNVRASIDYGQYTFESVPVDGDALTTFYLYDPNPGAKEDRTLGDYVTYNFAISSPENGSVVLTESETDRTIDIEIKRIAVNITGTISGIKEQVSVYLKQGETTIAYVSSNMVGDYKFQGVQPGTYTVVVDKYGYDQKNTPTVTVTSIEAGDVSAEAIVLEGKDIETTITCNGLSGYNKYTGSTVYLKGATATLWACEDGAATGEALQTVTSEGDYASFSFTAFTTKFGTPYVVKVSHPDIEEAETIVNITSESTSVYFNSFVFKYDGPELLKAENFQYAWNAAKDTLILNWSWPEALKDAETYKIQNIGLNRKLASEANFTERGTYWDVDGTFASLPTTFRDSTAKDGNIYIYQLLYRYEKPYYETIEQTFTVDLRPDYTLTYAANNAAWGTIKSPTASGSQLKAGDLFQLIALPAEDFRFKEWINTANQETLGTRDTTTLPMPASDFSVQAVFEQYIFTIAVAADNAAHGEVAIEGTATKFELGEDVTVKATPKAGYRFISWKEGETVVSTKATYTFKAEKNRTLTAVFEEVKYVLGLGVNQAEWGKVEGTGEFKAGTEVTAKATANEGYKFVAWMDGEEKVSTEAAYTFNMPAKDLMLTAVFEDATTYYTVTLQANKAEWGKVEGSDKYAAGTNATIKATANEGYHFVAWMDGETKVSEDAVYTFKVEKDITLTAVFAEGAANEELEAALWTVYAENSTIVIKGLSGDRYSVYDLNGRLAGQALCTGAEIRIDVASNKLYIVRRVSAAGLFGAKKIVVR